LNCWSAPLHAVAETGEVVETVESNHGEKMLSMDEYRRRLRRVAGAW
jgi:hypothetical protein